MLIRRGHLTREPCRFCGAFAGPHHPDYNRPRLVEWMCRNCHGWFHWLVNEMTHRLDRAVGAGVGSSR